MKGLYFYKLVSPYMEDMTKDCKLTVTEIDHNFITLKDGMVKSLSVDTNDSHLVLELQNGDLLKAELPTYVKNVSAEYDKENGVITLYYDNTTKTFDGLFTTNNIKSYLDAYVRDYVLGRIEKEVVITDETLNGCGVHGMPLGLNIVEKTAYFKSVKKVIDMTDGSDSRLPYGETTETGDRYITIEYSNPFGYLYSFSAAKKIESDSNLKGWRIPSKKDWDGMLNAIEVCDEDKNHGDMSTNFPLGRVAGKLLKATDTWQMSSGKTCDDNCGCPCHTEQTENEPASRTCTYGGVDVYGMGVLPCGWGCKSGNGYETHHFSTKARFWTTQVAATTDVLTKQFDYDQAGVTQMSSNPNDYCSLRLVKDYTGDNFDGIEVINGVAYKTVLMPSTTSDNGYAIWMGSNAAFIDPKYDPIAPNANYALAESKMYFINEWNGFEWVKRIMVEGDSLVIIDGPDGSENNEFRIINGVLTNANLLVVNEVINKYDTAIAEMNVRIDAIDDKVTKNIEVTNQLVEDLNAEIERSKSEDEIIKGRLIKTEGSTYSCVDGILTLVTEDPNNDIKIALDSNYGTF